MLRLVWMYAQTKSFADFFWVARQPAKKRLLSPKKRCSARAPKCGIAILAMSFVDHRRDADATEALRRVLPKQESTDSQQKITPKVFASGRKGTKFLSGLDQIRLALLRFRGLPQRRRPQLRPVITRMPSSTVHVSHITSHSSLALSQRCADSVLPM